MVMFDAPRVLEKGDARAQQNDQIVIVLLRRQHALVQQQCDLRHQKKIIKKPRTQIFMDLRYIDPQARVLNFLYK